MARFHPSRFPDELKADRAGAAEYAVFEALVDDLPDDWLVVHRVRWIDGPAQGWRSDGECDFLIAHPERGLLVLEVKGGHVGADAATGKWTSTDARGTAHEIQDPYGQAMRSKYALERHLKAHPKWKGRHVPIGHAVALPGCLKTGVAAPEASDAITIDADDLNRPREAIERALDWWHLTVHDEWTRDGLTLVERLFVHREFARLRLGARLGQHEREFLRLTAPQSRVLDQLRNYRRAAISGCAGSGKTMLAIEKARRLADEGYRVLLTCFNRALAEFMRTQLPPPRPAARKAGAGQLGLFGDPEVEVEHFHALAARWAKRAGIALEEPAPGDADRFYDSVVPEALLAATGRLAERFDAVIVDEGQDFAEAWWTPLQALLSDPDHGILYVFYDDNQTLYRRGGRLPIDTPPFALTTNLRNTRAIHREVVRWYRGNDAPDAIGPEGEKPETLGYRDETGLREHVRRVLHRLVHDEKVPEKDLVVLSPHGKTSALWRDPQFGNIRLTDAWPPAPNHVQFSTVYAFKGLERPVVVLAEVARTTGRLEEIRYVGSSRARSHLVIIEERTD